MAQFERGGCVRTEIPRPAGENAGLRDDARAVQGRRFQIEPLPENTKSLKPLTQGTQGYTERGTLFDRRLTSTVNFFRDLFFLSRVRVDSGEGSQNVAGASRTTQPLLSRMFLVG